MPPYYPNQYPNQYQNDGSYYDEYGQYQQYNPGLPQHSQPIPGFQHIQVTIPPRQSQPTAYSHSQSQPQPQPLYYPQHAHPQGYISPVNQQAYHFTQQPQYVQQQSPQPQYPYQHQQQFHYQPPQHPQSYGQLNQPALLQPMPQPSDSRQQPVQQPMPASRILQDVQPNAHRQPVSSKPPAEPEPELEDQEPRYDILLLTLADEYLDAAAKLTVRTEDYYKLTATALGCIQSVLNNFKLPPLREAQLGLRFAQILYNETENNDDAETILTKNMGLCERMKFFDLKYASQLLLAKVLYRSNARAGLKDLEGMIEDSETYRHLAWNYAFRLQHIMFLAASNSPSDIHAAIVQAGKLASTAKKNGDDVIYAFAAILEAMLHLRTSSSEAVVASDRCLASARALQLNPGISENPQILILTEFVDLCGQIKDLNAAQSERKRKVMQQTLYKAIESLEGWRNDGIMYIALKSSSLKGLQLQDGGVIMEKDGKHFLAFQWLSKDEVEDLGYLLSGISAAQKNAGDGGKAERFIDEGLDMLQELMKEKRSVNRAADAIHSRRELVECHFLLELAFLQCSKGQWDKARKTVASVEAVIQQRDEIFPSDMKSVTHYVKGAILQGQGNLNEALHVFSSSTIRLTPQESPTSSGKMISSTPKQSEVARDISILAAINSVFIILPLDHPQHHRLQGLINILDPVARNSLNKTIRAAYNFVLASLPNNKILQMKQYLSEALNAAKTLNNAQITTLCLIMMQEKFFKGVVSDQALKCARAATHQAKRLNEPMWVAVASGLESECLAMQDMNEDAAQKREEATRIAQTLPEKVRQRQ